MDRPLTKTRRKSDETMSYTNLAGQTFGDFRILRSLGQGGMGQVYLAEQVSLKRKVALKMLREDVAVNPTALARFRSESTTIAKLSHANVVQAHMVGEQDGRHYLVMEYVEGTNLRDYMVRKGPLDVPLVLSIMRQVANALQHAGDLDIVHRDIKPENIMLSRKGEVKVADFGLSRCLGLEKRVDLTREGSTVGTPRYMSPEQVKGKHVDCRSDIYSFGATCYDMLAGRPPFGGSNAYVIASKHMREEPAALQSLRAELPEELCNLIHRMLAKKPDDRPASAQELLQEISRVRRSLNSAHANANTPVPLADDTPIDDVDDAVEATAPASKRPLFLALGGLAIILGSVALLAVIAVVGVAAYVLTRDSEPPALVPVPAPAVELPALEKNDKALADSTEALKQIVDKHLKESPSKPGGVDSCVDLAVLYLEQKKTSEAETLFRRMCERRPPSSYYFVGRLGLAVTDALHKDNRGSHAKFMELFDSKAKDNRTQILNDVLTRKPEFAAWVNEADSYNVRNGIAVVSPLPKSFHRPIGGGKMSFPFKK